MYVLGRDGDPTAGPTVHLGEFLARDGSTGAAVGVDADRPHAAVVVGKRGAGKSYTLGVIAEGLADAPGVAPVIVDPMGVFGGLEALGGDVIAPQVRPATLPPAVWPDLLGLDPAGAPGGLLWRVVAETVDRRAGPASIAAFRDRLSEMDAPEETRRVVRNHLDLAASWGVFDPAAPPVTELLGGDPTVIDLAGTPEVAAGAVVSSLARGLYDACVEGDAPRLPWLLIDEAHAYFGGIADPALRTVLTRGRAPGVSLVCATQRPEALPPVAISQSDLIVAHRLTAERDVDRLREAEATYLDGSLAARLPEGVGEALVVDDATEEAHTVRVRERRTPHGGSSPRASEVEASTVSDRRSSTATR
ncbi:ATP-binding protein [Halorubrum vacuolatum]|uniref:AAA+ ATPase domain-containing protein n=1 Tax=Halorubrum vacuolatum TaxID=63740 RepID=A0A238W2G3_HALVU|nr:DUF87 domain-containing protein [Halorubrum vacuolatum]SNR40742.1 hypothetical protein SAMN06264855_10560 [Halorubrum vacuolatum]